ncbi:DUF4982 domain-containing protein [Aeoliella sp. ICT_H6.2]|uniref:DUF4982 domain-containing protein n=1 Tax=Aeoliella straminimaris TaxID=2954799 RepID=A0A9X2JHN4_9BACT|nr:glycoside hydrolase family 2 TIM barrel-domain containing protein [Aeoliella straminimaris]MCO6044818.1 DUF4982 domain-containing protein [Aeoliella straminimaris]
MLVLTGIGVVTPSAQGTTRDFNRGWKFHLGDVPDAQERTCDDTDWEIVRTPHDWAIAGPFDPDEHGYAGKLPWRGIGWYRKWMTVDRSHEGSQVYLDFDGVMSSPKVYVNGKLAGEWDYGYTPFRIDITPFIQFGRANVVAICVDNRRHGTRWYPGAGIYRNVSLVVSPPVHLAHGGTQITTPAIAGEQATVEVSNEIDSFLKIDQPVDVEVTIREPSGAEIHRRRMAKVSAAGERVSVAHEFTIDQPALWDVDTPNNYLCVTELRVQDQVVERRYTTFGIRSFQFTADDGFHLNGRRVNLRGVNLHHGLGALGAAFNKRAMRRRLELLQDMGVNAIRTSHNPPASELLDLCDEMGILVWDELFDKWDETAGRHDGNPPFEQYVARHAENFIRRDRNHPSVVVWSIGNEISNQPHSPEGKSRDRVRLARAEFLRHDDTRPVGIGCHIPDTAKTDILADLDVVGWNYQQRYDKFRRAFPEIPIIYSETASALSSRGQYRLPLPSDKCDYGTDGQLSAYELLAAPWADIPEIEFHRLKRDKFLAGEFVWTGFDYLGEPTPFEQDSRSSYFGIFDLVGFPKDRFYLYRSVWRPDTPTLHIAPHWNWPGHEGQRVPVMVYTNGDSAELFLNGKSLGVRNKGEAPPQPINLIESATIKVSSSNSEALTSLVDVDPQGWCAEQSDAAPRLTADLGEIRPLRSVAIQFPKESKNYEYTMEVSRDGHDWTTVVDQKSSQHPKWGGVKEAIHQLDSSARYLRLQFGPLADGIEPSIETMRAYSEAVESSYFQQTYDYRLRWNDVRYEPGELRAVAYNDGKEIAEQILRTAGPASALALTPDRNEVLSDGIDMVFIAIRAVDENGVFNELAENKVSISVQGPGTLEATANGDPTSMESFHSSQVQLFAGKAMAIIRPKEGLGGTITVRVESEGLEPAQVTLESGRE